MNFTAVTQDFNYIRSGESLIPDLIIFTYGGHAYKVEIDITKGWTTRKEYTDSPQNDKLIVVVRGKNKAVKIIQGKTVTVFRYVDIPVENIL